MNRLASAFLAIALSSTAPIAALSASLEEAQQPQVTAEAEGAGVPILTLLRAVAKKTGKKMIIDSRVHGNVQLIGEDISNVSYAELLAILQMQGLTAIESGGFARVIPDAVVRQSALPLILGTATYPDAQYAAVVIPVRKIPAASLVPILRPLLPQQAQLSASLCTNALLMVDTFANIRRVKSLIALLDTGDSYKPDRCESTVAHPETR